jgi:diacylglycerol kinase family enzyme
MAKNDDEFLDLVIVEPVGRLRIFTLLPRLVNGSHISAPEVTCVQVNSVRLIADGPVPSHLDGEVQALQTDFQIEILKRALAIL